MLLDMVNYKKFSFINFNEITMFREASRNPNLPSQFINMNFCITLKSVRGSMVSTITRIYAGRSEVQILDGARELSLLQNIQVSSCAQPASNSKNTRDISQAVKWPGHTV